MIIQSQESKGKTSLIDLLGGNAKGADAKSNGLFSKLLASLASTSPLNDFKTTVDPKNAITKGSEPKSAALRELQTLLGGENEQSENAFVSQELLSTLSDGQVRTLIHRAKEYLKNTIAPHVSAPESLPKSLAGLIEMADKMGLEPQSITLSTLMSEGEGIPPELLSKPLLEAKALMQPGEGTQPEKGSFEAITQLLGDLKHKKEAKAASDEPALSSRKEEHDPQPLKTLLQGIEKRDAADTAPAKEGKHETTAAASNSPGTALISLLQGEGEAKNGQGSEPAGGKMEIDLSKPHQSVKSDSLEVKAKEAQQSMRHFASDLKEAVENYKPPFTRISMKLNPEKLGEVEVTLVQRGNNVHVNIQSSNAASVAFLAHNATELKAQLAHQGITNATMNFMGGGENPSQQGQQHQEHPHNRFRAYQSLTELELNEEQLGALELIIPHYA